MWNSVMLFLFLTENTLLGQILSSKLKFGTQKFQIRGIHDVHFFPILTRYVFWGKFCPKNQNFQFMSKFGTQTNSNMQSLLVMFTFSVCYQKYFFGANLIKKNQNCQFKPKFCLTSNSNMQHLVVIFIQFFCDPKDPFWANKKQKTNLSV